MPKVSDPVIEVIERAENIHLPHSLEIAAVGSTKEKVAEDQNFLLTFFCQRHKTEIGLHREALILLAESIASVLKSKAH